MATCTNTNMGFAFGLDNQNTVFKRKNRWLFMVDGISASGVNALPPLKSSRPSISFKEMEAQHLTETVYFPAKPEWKAINLTLYDIKNCEGTTSEHVVFEWLRLAYDIDANDVIWRPSCEIVGSTSFKKETADLSLYDGCGTRLERWIFEGVWPQNIEFGELDMASNDVVTCDLTLRYDRAYWQAF